VAIDLSLAGLMSETFLTFDRKTTEATRKSVIFELREADVLGDMGTALFVRDYLQSRGYRVALDGTNHLTLPLIGRERLGFDFIKLRWGPDYESAIVAAQRNELVAVIERIGQAQIILTDCRTARAVSAGQGLGIGTFQGAYIETMPRFEAPPRSKEMVSA
jgi:EAL domain-containing protein (putative c-di-GMP-specific phosphodiesterase class I)